jgi:hypothetical protein
MNIVMSASVTLVCVMHLLDLATSLVLYLDLPEHALIHTCRRTVSNSLRLVRIRGAEASEKKGIFGTCVGLLFVPGLFSVRRISRAVDMRMSDFVEQVSKLKR